MSFTKVDYWSLPELPFSKPLGSENAKDVHGIRISFWHSWTGARGNKVTQLYRRAIVVFADTKHDAYILVRDTYGEKLHGFYVHDLLTDPKLLLK